ncbi:MAG: chromate transporter [Dethiobacteria bacterium]
MINLNIFSELFISFFKIGLFGFGGGYSMLALLEREIVQLHKWLSATEFVDIIAVAEMTPGAVAINSATFVGYQIAGVGGAIIATLGVIIPSLLLVIPAARLVTLFYQSKKLQHALHGIHPAVLALIGLAAYVVGVNSIVDIKSALIGGGALTLLIFTRIHPLMLIALGAVAGTMFYL